MTTTLYIVKNANGTISGNLPKLSLIMMQGMLNTLIVDTFEYERVYIAVPPDILEYFNSIIYDSKCFVRGSEFVILPNIKEYSTFPNTLLEWNYTAEVTGTLADKQ